MLYITFIVPIPLDGCPLLMTVQKTDIGFACALLSVRLLCVVKGRSVSSGRRLPEFLLAGPSFS